MTRSNCGRVSLAAGARTGVAAATLLLAAHAAADGPVEFSAEERGRILRMSPLPAPPPDPTNRFADSADAARLGQRIFFDPGFSADGKVSCATCHDPQKSFTDGVKLGAGLAPLVRHTPSLWNVAHNRWFFWDGRADTLWSQALIPLEHPDEHGFSRLQVAHRLHAQPPMQSAYEKVFGPLPPLADAARFPPAARPDAARPDSPLNVAWEAMRAADRSAVDRVFANAGKAIAAYVRKLRAAEAPFDRFVEGLRTNDENKLTAISPAAQRGLKLFIGRGNCRFCHAGPNFTDGEFHDIRIPTPDGAEPADAARYAGIQQLERNPFNAAGEFSDAPDGVAARLLRFTVNSSENWGRFKTPSLRNVALTAPYMHAGHFATLDEVIHYYSTLDTARPPGHHGAENILAPLNLSDGEKADLRAFLESLTDDSLPTSLRKPPAE